ncbi:hypothetical protein F4815DRAFT_222234 [Daldinia loculata]|nr:hypothetical protein F4815DRAFT_222234 [Daldinia loculata]
MDIRPKLPRITSSPNLISSQYTFVVKHPGYGNEDDPLLQFVHFDEGLDYDLVIYACCIVAGNAWPLEMKNQKRIDKRPDGGKLGYVYLSRSKKPNEQEAIARPNNVHYPFTPTFDHWIFPHGDLPPPWQKVAISQPACTAGLSDDSRQATLTRDQTCRITNSYTALERAHIIPSSANRWYRANAMGLYTGPMGIDSMENSMALRRDVHHLWDKNMEIILLPKERENKYHLVSHALKPTRVTFKEIKKQYHNLECQDLYEIRREYLFARFAWSIFHANTVTIHKAGKGPYKLLLSVEDAMYPQTQVKDALPGQIPLPSLPRTDLPDSGPPSKKRSLSRSNKNRHYYSVDDQIIDLNPYSNTYTTRTTRTTRTTKTMRQLIIIPAGTIPSTIKS